VVLCALAQAALGAVDNQPPGAGQLSAFRAAKTVSLDWNPNPRRTWCIGQPLRDDALKIAQDIVETIVYSHGLTLVPEKGDLQIQICGYVGTLGASYLPHGQQILPLGPRSGSVWVVSGTSVNGSMVLSAAGAKPYKLSCQGIGGTAPPPQVSSSEIPGNAHFNEALDNGLGRPLRYLLQQVFGAPNPALLHQRDCEKGDLERCLTAALGYERGDGVADKAMAAQLFLAAALRYERGDGVAQNKALAAQFYQKACDRGQFRACTSLGVFYSTGQGVTLDSVKAVRLFQTACEQSYSDGCGNLGFMYYQGEGLALDKTKAAQLFEKACAEGGGSGCTGLGLRYQGGDGVAQDSAMATQFFRKACDLGDAAGCSNLGVLHSSGQGVPQDKAKAAQLFQTACDRGFALGCWNLAPLYMQGQGVTRSPLQAFVLAQKACDNGQAAGCHVATSAAQSSKETCEGGSGEACGALGLFYQWGVGVAQDKGKAVLFYQEACDAGNADGCVNLGVSHQNGSGTPPDIVKAWGPYKKACDAGAALGCAYLGELYAGGADKQSRAEAVRLCQSACQKGISRACDFLKSIK
jgi:TPR repeat protein